MSNANLKTRLRIELFALMLLTASFLSLFPQRPAFVDVGLALVALLLIVLNAHFTKTMVWGPFALPQRKEERFRTCLGRIFSLTLPLILVLFGIGMTTGYASGGWTGAFNRVFNWHLLVVLILYLPWALLQQTLFQFYLFGRLLSLFPKDFAIACTGIAFGVVHLPDIWIMIATSAAGILWTSLYDRYRVLTPLALSHATLGSTFYDWAYGRDLLEPGGHSSVDT